MKRIYKFIAILSFFCAFSFTSKAQNDIDTLSWVWYMEANDDPYFCVYVSPNENFTVDWGDSIMEIYTANKQEYFVGHTYSTTDTFTVTVVGSPSCRFTRLYLPYQLPRKRTTHLSMKCRDCITMQCYGNDQVVGNKYYGYVYDPARMGKLHTIDITTVNNPTLKNGGIDLRFNQLRLGECYKAALVTSAKNNYATNTWTKTQHLIRKDVARGENVNFSADTAFILPGTSTLHHTVFEVFKKDSLYPCPQGYAGGTTAEHGYCAPAIPNYDYIETKGNVAFYRPGEYFIKMTNAAVRSGTPFSVADTAEVYQAIRLLPKDDACLDMLAVSEGVLEPVFRCDTLHYIVNVGYKVSSIIITATPSDTFATMVGDTGLHALQVGVNTFTITVTAEDGITTKTYTVDVIRTPASTDACLDMLAVSEGVLEPVFECETLNYTVEVAYKISSVIITAITRDSNAILKGDIGLQSLQVGVNVFTITVTAEDGITTKTYTIRIKRSAPSDACLTSLSVSQGVLSPKFECDSLYYTVSDLPFGVSSLVITATSADPEATVTGDIGSQSLQIGLNTFHILVTAKDEVTTKAYTIEVIRIDGGMDACLATLDVESVLAEGKLRKEVIHPGLDCRILTYTVHVENSISKAVISATPSDPNARVSGIGEKKLQVGENIFPIVVTSEKGNMQRHFKVVINRAGENGQIYGSGLLIYPNPTDGLLNIDNYNPTMGDIGIYDAAGKLLQQIKPQTNSTNEKIILDISHYAKGVYFVIVDGEAIRFIKE